MPTNKHKRKASAHSKTKIEKPPGLIATHPKAFGLIGLFLVAVSAYLLVFESQDDAMFGLAMLSLVTGGVLAIFAKVTITNKKQGHV